MAEVINLRRARKGKARQEKDKKAESNRVTHGTSKDLRELGKARAEKDARDLDGHKKD